MDPKKYAVLQIMKFLAKEAINGGYGSDTNESLEVARQCLESAYEIKSEDIEQVGEVDLVQTIWKMKPKKMPSEADRKMAETLKNQGNICLGENLIDEAIECYTKAIELVDNSAVYYCNRAAAFTHLGEHDKALADCRKAIEIDPNYSKAYGRMGLAYANQGEFQNAVNSYRRALECDPGNESYQQNLQLSQARLAAAGGGRSAAGGPSMGPTTGAPQGSSAAPQMPFNLPGGIDLGSVMNNPMFMNMATQVMSDPAMRNSLNSMMQMFLSPREGGAAAAAPDETTPAAGATEPSASAASPDMDVLLRMGEQFAEQMRTTNPELVEQLRGRFQQRSQEPRGDQDPAGGPANSDGGASS